ncbi:MAG: hypothetical protein GY950_22115, partial [bacterium]|nr:hypothetical protein [bacterium]
KKVVFRFSTFRKGVVQKTSGSNTSTFSFSNSAVTPVMVQAFHNNKIYYGMNDTYRITVKDLDLKTVADFSLEREKTKVPDAFKKEVVKELDFPDSVKLEMKKGLPDHFTYFQGIFADANENIYVYVTDPGEGKLNSRKLDIFSPGGKYIYSAEIVIEEGLDIQGSHLKKDKLYLEVENEDGDLKVIKYKIHLPRQAGVGKRQAGSG